MLSIVKRSPFYFTDDGFARLTSENSNQAPVSAIQLLLIVAKLIKNQSAGGVI